MVSIKAFQRCVVGQGRTTVPGRADMSAENPSVRGTGCVHTVVCSGT